MVPQIAGNLLRSVGARAPHDLGRRELRQVNDLRRPGHIFSLGSGAGALAPGIDSVRLRRRVAFPRLDQATRPRRQSGNADILLARVARAVTAGISTMARMAKVESYRLVMNTTITRHEPSPKSEYTYK